MAVPQVSNIERHPHFLEICHEFIDVDEKRRTLAEIFRKYSVTPHKFSEQGLGRFYNKKWPRFKAELRLTASMTTLEEFREMSRQAWRETMVTLALFRTDMDKDGKKVLVSMHTEMRELMSCVGVALGVVSKEDDESTDAEEQRLRGAGAPTVAISAINHLIVVPQPSPDAAAPRMDRPPKKAGPASTQMLRIMDH